MSMSFFLSNHNDAWLSRLLKASMSMSFFLSNHNLRASDNRQPDSMSMSFFNQTTTPPQPALPALQYVNELFFIKPQLFSCILYAAGEYVNEIFFIIPQPYPRWIETLNQYVNELFYQTTTQKLYMCGQNQVCQRVFLYQATTKWEWWRTKP